MPLASIALQSWSWHENPGGLQNLRYLRLQCFPGSNKLGCVSSQISISIKLIEIHSSTTLNPLLQTFTARVA